MQEKDIKKKLNQELEEMAPDILNKILIQPIEPVKSEKELFGKNKPLFKEKKKISKFVFAPAITAFVACLLFSIFLFDKPSSNPNVVVEQSMAFSIIIDVNPSITIEVNDDGNVEKIVAGNKDAKKIVSRLNKNIESDISYNKAVKMVVEQLNKEGYLKKKNKAMLFSVVADNESIGEEKVAEVRKKTEKFTKKKKIKCKPIYQNCVVTERIKDVAEKNNISVGKAAFCIKIAEKKKDIKVEDICDETIDNLVVQAEYSGITVNNVVIEETATVYEETSETVIGETETTVEGETTSEFDTGIIFETTTGPNGETAASETINSETAVSPADQPIDVTQPNI